MEKIKILNGKKKDYSTYLNLRKTLDKEYSKIIERKTEMPERIIKKEYSDLLKNKEIILFIQLNNKIVGFLTGEISQDKYYRTSRIYDFFVLKEYRGKGFGRSLLKEFFKLSKNKSIKKIRIGTNVKNIYAVKLYKNLGFKVVRYEMEKQI